MKTRHPARWVAVVAAATVATLLAACAESTSDDPLVAGTGSSGGNPATISFQLTQDTAAEGQPTWDTARIAAASVSFGRFDDAGACVFGDEVYALGAFIRFDASQFADIDTERLCRIAFRPPEGEPLVQASGRLQTLQVVLDLFLPEGVDLAFDPGLPTSSAERPLQLVVAFRPGALTEAFDFALLPREDDLIRLSDLDPALRRQLVEQVTGAVGVYLDPTPATLGVTRAERIDDNLVGRAALPSL